MGNHFKEIGGKYIDTFSFSVNGRPAPQGSKKHVGNGRMVESSKHVKVWRHYIKVTAHRLRPDGWCTTMGVNVSVEFLFQRPKSHFLTNGELRPSSPKHCTTRVGDIDKLVRALADALTGVAYEDDSQIIQLNATKRYARNDEREGANVWVSTISPE